MIFDIITIFPHIFDSYLEVSFIKKARDKGLIDIRIYNLRDFTSDRHRSVDDRPFGGGLGMVMKVEPIYQAVKRIKPLKKRKKIVLFTPRGRKFNQRMAYQFSKLDQLILICGRYEGVDERVAKHIADLSLSIGDYDLMGGELPAMVVIEAVSRLIPGVIGKPEFLKERIVKKRGRGGRGFIEYPQYTRPAVFEPKRGIRWQVPKVLLSGNHKEIEKWRERHKKVIEK
ncbi:MAG TPA: tRNA (guanosine(37)-N1)-methyltransferase TrmD [bacterium]|nr:tRNA (guanosine(37)-N1)-methyltransferase TrmD [bacterium]